MIARLKRYNIGYWALSLLLAIMLWLFVMVQTVTETQKTLTIRPVFVGAEELLNDKEIQVTGGTDVTLDIRLRGRRTELIKCTEDTVTATVELTDITSPGHNALAYKIQTPANDVSVVWTSSPTIYVTSDKIVRLPVDVKFIKENIKMAQDYALESYDLLPEQVRVRGPSEALARIDHVQVAPSKENLDRTTTLALPFVFIDKEGNEIIDEALVPETQEITVTLHVLRQKAVDLRVELVDGGGAMAKNARVTVEPSSIVLSGDPTVLESLHAITLDSIYLSEVTSGHRVKFPIVIPNGVENQSGLSEAWVTVELTGLITQNFDVTNISAINANLPDGYELQVITKNLPLTLRGPETAMDQVTVYNVRVVADLSVEDLAIGQQNVPVKVYVDGYPDVGAMGVPTIAVEVASVATQ